MLKELMKEKLGKNLEDFGFACSELMESSFENLGSISSMLFHEDLHTNEFLISPESEKLSEVVQGNTIKLVEEIGNIDKDAIEIIDFISPPETDYANRDIAISTENYYEGMGREEREDESNVDEVMIVTSTQVSFPEQSQQKAIKGSSQLDFDDFRSYVLPRQVTSSWTIYTRILRMRTVEGENKACF
ncbi:unnamed protein product [Cuscuta europaea]|uniref:Uncharacterized protein n=1 Tax=Cuscuta europaea TaxID=41803 RepID=A0A9P0YJ32_CUSEU|nr:unnamed protein product [Cuscuta europaea]